MKLAENKKGAGSIIQHPMFIPSNYAVRMCALKYQQLTRYRINDIILRNDLYLPVIFNQHSNVIFIYHG